MPGSDGGVAGAAADVENAFAGLEICGLEHLRAERAQKRIHPVLFVEPFALHRLIVDPPGRRVRVVHRALLTRGATGVDRGAGTAASTRRSVGRGPAYLVRALTTTSTATTVAAVAIHMATLNPCTNASAATAPADAPCSCSTTCAWPPLTA